MYRTTTAITDSRHVDYLLRITGSTGLFIHFGIFTALRISEILSLKWGDVMQDGNVKDNVRVRITKQEKKKKRTIHPDIQKMMDANEELRIWIEGVKPKKPVKKYREITFHDALKARIKDMHMRTNPRLDQYIFVSESNNSKGNVPMTKEAMNLRLKPILLKVGAQHPSSHTLRKTMARRYYEQFGIVATMQLLGHSSEAMTMVYIGLSRETMSINMKSLSYQ